MLEFSGPEVAALAELPYITLAKYERQGVVGPSVHKGEGRGTVSRWNLVDLVAIASFGLLRPSPNALGTLKALFDAWHRPRARELVAAAAAAPAGQRKEPSPAYILVTDDGRVIFEKELNLAAACKKHGPRVFAVDAARLVETLLLEGTTRRMTFEPEKKKAARERKRRAKVPAPLLKATTRHGGEKPRRNKP